MTEVGCALIGTKIGIDLGSSNIRVFVEGRGLIYDEPSVVACEAHSGKALAFGDDAKQMLGRTPDSLVTAMPIKFGAVADYELSRQLLSYFIEKVCRHKYFKPNVVVSMHGGLSKLEKRTILDLVYSADAARAFFIEEPLAAAIGAGISFDDNAGYLVADLGGGTTDIAVVSMGRVVESQSIRMAGSSLTEAIVQYLLQTHGVSVGLLSAQKIKHRIGGAILHMPEIAIVMNGKHQKTSIPLSFEVNSSEIYWLMQEHLNEIADSIRGLIEKTPPEFMADIADKGLMLTGKAASLYGIAAYMQKKLSLDVRLAENSGNCVINGLGSTLGNLEKLYSMGIIHDLESLRENAE